MPDAWLSTVAGLHVPVIPLVDVAGKAGTLLPAQMVSELPKLNAGVTIGLTVTLNVVVVAQIPALGVNVYTPDAWSSTRAGLHVPATPLDDVLGNAGTVPPVHMLSEVPKLKVGMILGVTVSVYVNVVAHTPAAGVNV